MLAARSLPPLLCLLLLEGCFSGLRSQVPPEQRFLLTGGIASVPASGPRAGTVQVQRPSAAPGLAGARIAVLRSGARIDYYANARWAEDAPALLQSRIIDALRGGGRFATVESDTEPFAAQYLLSVDIVDFQAEYDASGAPTAHVTLICTLGRRSDRGVIVSFAAQGSAHAGADHLQAVVAAFGAATAQAMQQIAENLGPPPADSVKP
jgi:cholesterol transport system auxiliary component